MSAIPAYEFSCAEHGHFDKRAPMGDIPQVASCPVCSGDAPRVFSSPLLNLGDSGARRLLDATNATADAPRVVGAPPSGSRRPQRVTYDPRAQKLPRA
ncbi:FmdB family zinc ribbon protein [Salinibacterium sp. UTAS2018]|uniref:FmdB family zinc ribbon protein n=1 Tax=Salinibacterium sp. UTAS2018 TaxID=2508880 RepID=UPI001AEFAF0F